VERDRGEAGLKCRDDVSVVTIEREKGKKNKWGRTPLLSPSQDALENVFRPLHTRYAQHVNRARKWKGHLWQGRFFSSALDERYLWAALRYVERNPVRARIVRKAEYYRWSSAAAHCGLREDATLTYDERYWLRQLESVGDRSEWLAEDDRPDEIEALRRHVERGLPCGSEKIVRKLERIAGQTLRYRPRGRPKKPEPAR